MYQLSTQLPSIKKINKRHSIRPPLFLIILLLFLSGCRQNESQSDILRLPIEDSDNDQWPDLWEYYSRSTPQLVASVDRTTGYLDQQSITLNSNSPTAGPNTILSIGRPLQPYAYKGKRLQLSGYIKTEHLQGSAFLWFRIDGVGRNHIVAFDNMILQPISGTTDWQKYTIVLDAPQNASRIYYGVGQSGIGQSWFDQLELTVVPETTPLTAYPPPNPEPTNLDFSLIENEFPLGWQFVDPSSNYTLLAKPNNLQITFTPPQPETEQSIVWLTQMIDATPYRGKRIQIETNFSIPATDPTAKLHFSVQSWNWTVPNSFTGIQQSFSHPATNGRSVLDIDEKADYLYLILGIETTDLITLLHNKIEIAPADTALSIPESTAKQRANEQRFDQIWETVNQYYLYPNFNGRDWKEIGQTYRSQINPEMTQPQFWELIATMIEELADDHSYYLDPIQVLEEEALLRGEPGYSGIGIYVRTLSEKGYHVILTTFADSPAVHAGLKTHDRILLADGQPVCCDEFGAPLVQIRGPSNTDITLTVQTPNQAVREITVTRRQINGSWQLDYRYLRDNIAYILIPTLFYEGIGELVEEAWIDLSQGNQPTAVILDMRINGGGLNTELQEILALFSNGKQGDFFSRTQSRPLSVIGQDINGSQTVPIVILTSEWSESYAEVLSGSLQDNGRAIIVGTQTAGNVETLYPYTFSDKSTLWLAQESYRTNKGTSWEGVGITPDIIIHQDWDQFATDEEDLALQKAISWILQNH